MIFFIDSTVNGFYTIDGCRHCCGLMNRRCCYYCYGLSRHRCSCCLHYSYLCLKSLNSLSLSCRSEKSQSWCLSRCERFPNKTKTLRFSHLPSYVTSW